MNDVSINGTYNHDFHQQYMYRASGIEFASDGSAISATEMSESTETSMSISSASFEPRLGGVEGQVRPQGGERRMSKFEGWWHTNKNKVDENEKEKQRNGQ